MSDFLPLTFGALQLGYLLLSGIVINSGGVAFNVNKKSLIDLNL